jgi:chromosome segregation ATPase
MDLIKNVAEDEYRKRQEIVAGSLQNQIEELRRQVKDALAKSMVLEDARKNTLSRLAEVTAALDLSKQERTQAEHLRSVDDQRSKRLLAELQERIDLPVQQIRQLQAQMADVIDQLHKDRDFTANGFDQYDALKQRLSDLQPRLARIEESQSQLKELVGELVQKAQEDKRAFTRLQELWQIEIQKLDRRNVELDEKIDQTAKDKSDFRARLQWLEEQRKNDRNEIEKQVARMDLLDLARDQTTFGLQKITDQLTSKDGAIEERIELYRTVLSHDISDLAEIVQSRFDRIAASITEWEDDLRSLEGRLGLLPGHFEELRQRDQDLLVSLSTIEEQRVVRRMEQLQRELDDLRRRRGNGE